MLGYTAKGKTLHDSDRLLQDHMMLIRYHSDQLYRQIPSHCLDKNELVNAGVIGLLDAAQRFDRRKNVAFKTFASFRIRGSMIDLLRSHDWMSRTVRDHANDVKAVMQSLQASLGRPAEEAEIAAALDVSVEVYRQRLQDVRQMSVLSFEDLSLDDGEDRYSLLETLSANADEMPDRYVSVMEVIEQLSTAITQLPERERVMMALYYYEGLNMKEVALVLELTESRVSQLHSQLVLRLRSLMGLSS